MRLSLYPLALVLASACSGGTYQQTDKDTGLVGHDSADTGETDSGETDTNDSGDTAHAPTERGRQPHRRRRRDC